MPWLENCHFKYRQLHGRSDNQLNGNTMQLNSCYHLGRQPARLHTTISTQLAFYPNAINTPHVFHPMPKVNTLSAIVWYCLHIFTSYCCSPHPPVTSPSCGSPCHVPKPREPTTVTGCFISYAQWASWKSNHSRPIYLIPLKYKPPIKKTQVLCMKHEQELYLQSFHVNIGKQNVDRT